MSSVIVDCGILVHEIQVDKKQSILIVVILFSWYRKMTPGSQD